VSKFMLRFSLIGLCLLSLFFSSCQEAYQRKVFLVDGHIEGGKSLIVKLESVNPGVILDSTKCDDNGNFLLKASIGDEENFYLIRLNKTAAIVVGKNGDKLTFSTEKPTLRFGFSAEGNPGSEQLSDLSRSLAKLRDSVAQLEKPAQSLAWHKGKAKVLQDFIALNPSLPALYAAQFVGQTWGTSSIVALAQALKGLSIQGNPTLQKAAKLWAVNQKASPPIPGFYMKPWLQSMGLDSLKALPILFSLSAGGDEGHAAALKRATWFHSDSLQTFEICTSCSEIERDSLQMRRRWPVVRHSGKLLEATIPLGMSLIDSRMRFLKGGLTPEETIQITALLFP